MYLFSFLTKKNIGILELQYKKLYKMERETVTYNIRKKRKTNKDLDYNNSPRRFRPLGKEIGKAWRKNLTRAKRASLTRPVPDLLFDCSHVLEYAKIRTVLQSITAVHDCIHSHVGKNASCQGPRSGGGAGDPETKRQVYEDSKAHYIHHRCLCFIFDQTTMAQE